MYDLIPFEHIVLGKVGSLDEDLNVGGEHQWSLSELFAKLIRQWPLWEDYVVRDWFERGRDLLERNLSFADGQFAVVDNVI